MYYEAKQNALNKLNKELFLCVIHVLKVITAGASFFSLSSSSFSGADAVTTTTTTAAATTTAVAVAVNQL